MSKSSVHLAFGLACTFAGATHAGEFNNKAILTGERAAGLGGAYVGLSDDHTGMFYNPAGIVYASTEKASASVNVLSGSNTSYDKVFGKTQWSRESLELVPGFFGGLARTGFGTVGFSIVVVDSIAEDQTDRFTNVTIGSSTYRDLRVHNDLSARAYDLGLSWAGQWSSEWSAGTTLYLRYRDKDSSYLQRLSNPSSANASFDEDSILVDVHNEDTEISLRPVFGLMYRSKAISAGLALSRNLPLTRDYFYAYTAEVRIDDDDPATPIPTAGAFGFEVIDESSRSEDGPWHFAGGLSLFPSTETTWSVQLDYYFSRDVSSKDVASGAPPRDLATKSVLDVALGVEHRLSPSWLLRAGVYTDQANNDADDAALFERREEVDMYGATFSMTHSREVKHWTAGVQLAAGSGEATLGDVGFGSDTAGTVDAERVRYNIFLSTNF